MLDDFITETTCEEFYCDDYGYEDEPIDIDDDCGFDPYEGCYTWDC